MSRCLHHGAVALLVFLPRAARARGVAGHLVADHLLRVASLRRRRLVAAALDRRAVVRDPLRLRLLRLGPDELHPVDVADEVFADLIRQFDIPAANKMLDMPTLRKVLLPTIRAEFGMAYNFEYQPIEPFFFPISSFVGNLDPWVSEKDSAGWGKLTRGGFTNHVRKGSHFLMADDGEYILETINNEFVNSAIQERAVPAPS